MSHDKNHYDLETALFSHAVFHLSSSLTLRCRSQSHSDSPSPSGPAVGGSANGVVVTGEGLNELQEAKQRYGYMENDKDWEEYWERYEVEQKDDDPGKETAV